MNDEELIILITEYVSRLETNPTTLMCKCIWQEIPTPNGSTMKVIKESSLICPVHSKEGLILGFLLFLKNTKGLTLKP